MNKNEIMEQFECMLELISKNKIDKDRFNAGIRYAMGWFDSVLERKADENEEKSL